MKRELIYDAEITQNNKEGKPWQYKIQHFSEWEEFAAAPKIRQDTYEWCLCGGGSWKLIETKYI